MARVARRTLHGLLLLVGVSVFTFALLSAAPGNFFDELQLNPQISPQTILALKARYGMNDRFPIRYLKWLNSAARGDFGYSMSYSCPVGSLLWLRAGNTLLLAALATLLAWSIAIPWGIVEALRRGSWIDRAGGVFTALLLAIPDLLLGLLLLLFAARTGWFPTGGMSTINASASAAPPSFLQSVRDLALHLVLPVIALALGALPVLVRHVRAAVAAVLDSPFVEASRGLGIPPWRLIYRHVLPAAANSLISLLGFSIGALLSMSLLIEVVLSWPGLGPLVLEAMLSRDVYVVMAVVTLSSVFLVVGNLLADLLLYYTDPRIRTVSP
jgi:peptide/nickel transport system permease protein